MTFKRQYIVFILVVPVLFLYFFDRTAFNDPLHPGAPVAANAGKPAGSSPKPSSEMPRGYSQNYGIRNPFLPGKSTEPDIAAQHRSESAGGLIRQGNLTLKGIATVTIHAANADIREVLAGIAGAVGANAIIDGSVSGKITVHLVDIPYDQALEQVSLAKGLRCVKKQGVFIITADSKSGKNLETIRVIKLHYIRAEQVKSSLTAMIPEENLKIDESGNSIAFFGSDRDAELMQRAIAMLDVRPQQITLEAQILSVNKNNTRQLGVEWQWATTPAVPTSGDGDVVSREFAGAIQYGRNPENRPYEFQFQSRINALLTRGEAKLLSRPNVTTLDGQQAKIMIGDRIPVPVERDDSGGRTTITTEYVDAGIKLIYTPRVSKDGFITAVVKTEVSTPFYVAEMKAFRITTREAETQVIMRDGETIVIGGLIGSEHISNRSRIPFVSDLPLVGHLFRNSQRDGSDTEILIFITARIVPVKKGEQSHGTEDKKTDRTNDEPVSLYPD
ncbi:type II secretion system protein GspD [Acetonema longum]|uniref:Type II and III secretion system protein n=1 Tax=Acetonema longum DSM 6540 TaxID=1009370 RepID=F7NPQ9_9FIRM|nr:secretin N-terminal domain-containing protein [Acetonema longum]EGO61900.1 type II and III secretion system protein [Acetonema longum DSM 6540]